MKKALLTLVCLIALITFSFSSYSQTSGTFTDPRDGQTYKTVKIGEQVWMGENLNYKTDEGSFAYEDDEKLAEVYGRLYTYETALEICPSGWHLPGDDEWDVLIEYLEGEDIAGARLKETGTDHWLNTRDLVTNESGFTALPGGIRSEIGGFEGMGEGGCWWSLSADPVLFYILFDTEEGIMKEEADGYEDQNLSFSVRCIKD